VSVILSHVQVNIKKGSKKICMLFSCNSDILYDMCVQLNFNMLKGCHSNTEVDVLRKFSLIIGYIHFVMTTYILNFHVC